MGNKTNKIFINRLMGKIPSMTKEEALDMYKRLKYKSVGRDYDPDYGPTNAYWGELMDKGQYLYPTFEDISEEQFEMWSKLIMALTCGKNE